jgi:hypothetical protein
MALLRLLILSIFVSGCWKMMRDVGVLGLFVVLEGYWCELGTWLRKEWRAWRDARSRRDCPFTSPIQQGSLLVIEAY